MPGPDDDREIADASFLFDDRPEGRPSPDRPRRPGEPPTPDAPDPSPASEPASAPGTDVDDYDLADPGPDADPMAAGADPMPDEAAPAAPVPPPVERPRPARGEPKAPTPSPVDPPWSRLGEWWPALSRIALVALATIGLVYLVFSADRLALTLGIVAVGLAIMVLLSYPIAITLERPVRMTPEHALRDFYGALAHHLPHHRRMWLLLSVAGRDAPEFRSFPEFRSYWRRRLAALKGGKGGPLGPISVRIEQFKSEKSAGQEAIAASYTLSIFFRGREADGPLYSSRTETTLSRGPDRMWYLDDGRLPLA